MSLDKKKLILNELFVDGKNKRIFPNAFATSLQETENSPETSKDETCSLKLMNTEPRYFAAELIINSKQYSIFLSGITVTDPP